MAAQPFATRGVLPARSRPSAVKAAATPQRRLVHERPAGVWFFRALLLVPFVAMAPEIAAAVLRRPGSIENLSASTAGVLGTSSFVIFVMMLSVTPIRTVTGWKWHLVLRRDYGIGMFLVAALDLILSATTTGDTIPGGVVTRVVGRAGLFVGTLATFLLVPLVLTANRRAQRWLGPHWKWVHRLVYVVWVAVLLHLFLLFGLRGEIFRNALLVSTPLAVLRIDRLQRWWAESRRRRSHRLIRLVALIPLMAMLTLGLTPFVRDLAKDGAAAFAQAPPNG